MGPGRTDRLGRADWGLLHGLIAGEIVCGVSGLPGICEARMSGIRAAGGLRQRPRIAKR